MAALPGNAQVADQFDLLADLLELEGAESFRVIAYRRASSRMRETSASIAQLALDGNAKKLQGIGKTIEEKILASLAFAAQTAEAGDRRLLGDGLEPVRAVVAELSELPAAISVSDAGSVRRRKETFKDLDVIACATDPAELTRLRALVHERTSVARV